MHYYLFNCHLKNSKVMAATNFIEMQMPHWIFSQQEKLRCLVNTLTFYLGDPFDSSNFGQWCLTGSSAIVHLLIREFDEERAKSSILLNSMVEPNDYDILVFQQGKVYPIFNKIGTYIRSQKCQERSSTYIDVTTGIKFDLTFVPSQTYQNVCGVPIYAPHKMLEQYQLDNRASDINKMSSLLFLTREHDWSIKTYGKLTGSRFFSPNVEHSNTESGKAYCDDDVKMSLQSRFDEVDLF